jgi:copper chaperone CopZ
VNEEAGQNRTVEDEMETTTIRIEGMHCDGCAGRVKSLLEKEPGVREADVSHAAGEARVRYNEHSVGPDTLREIIVKAGYTPHDVP